MKYVANAMNMYVNSIALLTTVPCLMVSHMGSIVAHSRSVVVITLRSPAHFFL